MTNAKIERRTEDKLSDVPEHEGQRHPLLGALKGLIQVPPGIDLTQPADPDWGKASD